MRRDARPIDLLSPEEYLAREREDPRYEYVAGRVYAMSPEGKRHSRILLNLAKRLSPPSEAKGCLFFQDVMVRVSDDRYYYPDVVISCDAADADMDDIIRFPCVVFEVTSPSTRRRDLAEKTPAYQANASIQGILIVEQKRRRVYFYSRNAASEWEGTQLVGSGVVDVPCINVPLSLDEIYEGTDVPPMSVREEWNDEYSAEEYEREWARVDALRFTY